MENDSEREEKKNLSGRLVFKANWELHRTGEWLTWPAVADVAINKILANGAVVAGCGTTFVHIHFTEIPHEAGRTAGGNTSYFKEPCGCLTPAACIPLIQPGKSMRISCFLLFKKFFFTRSSHVSQYMLKKKKKNYPGRFNRRSSEAGNKFRGIHVHPTLNMYRIHWPFPGRLKCNFSLFAC